MRWKEKMIATCQRSRCTWQATRGNTICEKHPKIVPESHEQNLKKKNIPNAKGSSWLFQAIKGSSTASFIHGPLWCQYEAIAGGILSADDEITCVSWWPRKVDVGRTTESSRKPWQRERLCFLLSDLTQATSCPLQLRDLDASGTDAAALRVKSARESQRCQNPSAALLLYFCSFHILSQNNLKLNTVLTIVNFWFQLCLT